MAKVAAHRERPRQRADAAAPVNARTVERPYEGHRLNPTSASAMVAAVGSCRGGRGVLVVAMMIVPALVSCRQILGIHPTPAASCADPLMIDDMEDGDGVICVRDGLNRRHGPWVIVGDFSSMSTVEPAQGIFAPDPIVGGRGTSSHYAAHFAGSGFTDWGALMGFTLNDDQGLFSSTYKASAYGGITFWMKSNVPVAVNFRIPATSPVDKGGMCADIGTSVQNCNNNFQFRISAPPEPNQWAEYHVPFASLAQATRGHPRVPTFGDATWNADLLVGVQFDVELNNAFDVWIDDVAFYRCVDSECLPTCPASAPKGCPAKGLSPAACWPDTTNCFAIPTCTNPVAPIGCPASGPFPAGCGAPGTDCSTVHQFAVWGSGPDDLWTVGSRGTIGHWTGSAWSLPRSGTTEDLFAVAGSGADDVWAVGVRGAVVHWNGLAWSPGKSNTSSHLSGVWSNGPGDVWAVGAGGDIIHWDGSTWDGSSSKGESATTEDLFAVWGGGPQKDVWAVGAAGTIVHHQDGSLWSVEESGTTEPLLGVWGTSPDDVWAVGHLGTIVHRDSTHLWSQRASGVTQVLHGVWGAGPKDLWIVGDNVILHGDGDTWPPIQRGQDTPSKASGGPDSVTSGPSASPTPSCTGTARLGWISVSMIQRADRQSPAPTGI